MTFENYPEDSPFNTQDWIDFLKEEAERRGISYSALIAHLSTTNGDEYQLLEKVFITKYRKKHG